MHMDRFTLTLIACLTASAPGLSSASSAAKADITRDDWGIAHVHGRTDADAVFGMMYAQAEDDFNRIETNYLVSLGRLAEAPVRPQDPARKGRPRGGGHAAGRLARPATMSRWNRPW